MTDAVAQAPTFTLKVLFDADAYRVLAEDPAVQIGRARRMFPIEALPRLYPATGDLIADLTLAARVWRVTQCSIATGLDGSARLVLLAGIAHAAALSPAPSDDEPVKLTANAADLLRAEYAGKGTMPPPSMLMLNALRARGDLRPGDVVHDERISRQKFMLIERLFLWLPGDRVQVHFLFDAAFSASEYGAIGVPVN